MWYKTQQLPFSLIFLQGSLAYVPQQAWIQNRTVRDNIVFGKPFIKEKYENVLSACALRQDLTMLSDGDMTEIGEKVRGEKIQCFVSACQMVCMLRASVASVFLTPHYAYLFRFKQLLFNTIVQKYNTIQMTVVALYTFYVTPHYTKIK